MAKKKMTLEEKLEEAIVKDAPYEIPRNWAWVKLGDYIDYATDYVANGSFASLKANVQVYKDENFAVMVKTKDFNNKFEKDLTYTDEKGYEFLAKSKLFGGELILSNVGSIGKVFRVPYLDRPMTLASNSIMIKCHNELDYDYLYYLLLSPIGYDLLMSITTGTAVMKFNKTGLKLIPIPIPPIQEQQRIVDKIESLFEKLDKAKELIEEARDDFEKRKSAILEKAFRGELTKAWRKDNKLKYEFVDVLLGNIIEDGPKNGLYKPQSAYGEGNMIVRIDNFYDGKINPWNTLKKLKLTEDDISKYSLENGDLIINRVNSIEYLGKSALVRGLNETCVFESNIMRVKLKKVVNNEYVVYYLNSIRGLYELRKTAKHAVNQASINQQDVKRAIVPLPSLEEQKEIVRILDNLLEEESKIEELTALADKIELIKKSILAKAFRGKLGTNCEEDESALELLKEILSKDL